MASRAVSPHASAARLQGLVSPAGGGGELVGPVKDAGETVVTQSGFQASRSEGPKAEWLYRRAWNAETPEEEQLRRSLSRPLVTARLRATEQQLFSGRELAAGGGASSRLALASDVRSARSRPSSARPTSRSRKPRPKDTKVRLQRPSSASPTRSRARAKKSASPARLKPSSAYVRRLEAQVRELRRTVELTSHAGASQRGEAMAEATVAAIRAGKRPEEALKAGRRVGDRWKGPGFAEKVEKAAEEHAEALAKVEDIEQAKFDSQERSAALLRRLQAANAGEAGGGGGEEGDGEEGVEEKGGGGGGGGGGEEEDGEGEGKVEEGEGEGKEDEEKTVDEDEMEKWLGKVREGVYGSGSGSGSGGWKSKKKKIPVTRPVEPAVLRRDRERKSSGVLSTVERKVREDLAAKERELQEALSFRFRAKEVPSTTREMLFTRIMQQQETRRRLVHEARRTEVASSVSPFVLVEQHQREQEERAERERRRFEADLEAQLRESVKFRANPVPATTAEPDAEAKAREAREAKRAERVARRAEQLAAQSSLPPRMALWEEEHALAMEKKAQERREALRLLEVSRQEQIARGPPVGAAAVAAAEKQAKELEKILDKAAARPEDRFPYRPWVNPTVPDFTGHHEAFARKLSEARQSLPPTRPAPFSFDTLARREEERSKREERERRREERERERAEKEAAAQRVVDKERRERARGKRVGSGTDPVAAALGHSQLGAAGRADANAIASALGAGGFRVSMTRSATLRMEQRQREIAQAQRKEARLAAEEEARAREARRKGREIAPIVEALEEERRRGLDEPLRAWEMDKATAAAEERRKAWKEEAARREAENKARLEAAARRRPPLVLRATLDAQRDAARRQALLRVAAHVAAAHEAQQGGVAAGDAAWRAMATSHTTTTSSFSPSPTRPHSSSSSSAAEGLAVMDEEERLELLLAEGSDDAEAERERARKRLPTDTWAADPGPSVASPHKKDETL